MSALTSSHVTVVSIFVVGRDVAYITDDHRAAARLGCDEVLELLSERALLDECLDTSGLAACLLEK